MINSRFLSLDFTYFNYEYFDIQYIMRIFE